MLLLFRLSLDAAATSAREKAGGDDVPRRRRFEVQVKNVIHAFDTDQEAQAFLANVQASADAMQAAIRKAMEMDDEDAILMLL